MEHTSNRDGVDYYFFKPTVADDNQSEYLDATLVPFPGSESISIGLRSDQVDLNKQELIFRLIEGRDIERRDFLWNDKWWCILSDRLICRLPSLESLSKYPVRLEDYTGQSIDAKYWVLELPQIENLIDYSESDIVFNPVFKHKIMAVNHLVLKNGIITESDIFLLQELPTRVVVSRELQKELLKLHPEGVQFDPIN